MTKKRSFKKKANSKRYIKTNRKKTKSYKRTKTKGGTLLFKGFFSRKKKAEFFLDKPGFYTDFKEYIGKYFKFPTNQNEWWTRMDNVMGVLKEKSFPHNETSYTEQFQEEKKSVMKCWDKLLIIKYYKKV